MADISGEVPVPKGHVKRMAELFNEGAVSNIALPADRGRTVSMGSPGNGGERSIDRLLVASSDGNVSLEERNVLSVSRETTTTDNGHPERSASVILSEYWNTRRRTVDAYLSTLPTEYELANYKSNIVSVIQYIEACMPLTSQRGSDRVNAAFLEDLNNDLNTMKGEVISSLERTRIFKLKAEQMDSWIVSIVQNCDPDDPIGAKERIDDYVAEMKKLYSEIPYNCADMVSSATHEVSESRGDMRSFLSKMRKKARLEQADMSERMDEKFNLENPFAVLSKSKMTTLWGWVPRVHPEAPNSTTNDERAALAAEARERAEKKLGEKLAPKIAELAAERGELTVVAKNTPPIGAIKKWSARPIFSSVGPLSQLRPENATERTLREVEVARPSSDTVADGASVSGSFQNASP